MRGIDVFCERCGARQPTERRENPASGAALARRLRSAVRGTTADGVPEPTNAIFLRLCLECRGYSCPSCWNDEAGVCQTCSPLPEPEVAAPPDIEVALPPVVEPVFEPVVVAPIPAEPIVVEPVMVETVVPFMSEPAITITPEPVVPIAVELPKPVPEPTKPAAPTVLPEPRPAPAPLRINRPAPPPPSVVPTPLPVAARPATPAPLETPHVSDPVVPAPVVLPRPRPTISFEAPAVAEANPTPIRPAVEPYHLPLPTLNHGPVSTGVRPCRNCQLAVSAKAHFCRRCGMAQLAS